MTEADWKNLKTRFQKIQPGWQTAAVIALDLCALTGAVYLKSRKEFAASLGAVALLTLFLLHAYLLLHEATHSAISKNKALNDAVGHICGWLILMPYLQRQRSHLLHHMWTGHPKGDPANQRIIRGFSVMTEDQALRLERIWSSWLPILTLNDRIGMWKDPFRQRRNGAKSQRFEKEIRATDLYLAGYAIFAVALVMSGWTLSFLSLYLPAAFLQLVLEELANLPHHAETPLLNEEDKALAYWEQHRVTHSCKTLPLWSKYVLLNFNQHTAHHLFPWIPWHGLEEVQTEIKKHLPGLEEQQEMRSELSWSLSNRRRPLLEIMGHYFDKIPRAPSEAH